MQLLFLPVEQAEHPRASRGVARDGGEPEAGGFPARRVRLASGL